jgi:lycopene cyclase-like protein
MYNTIVTLAVCAVVVVFLRRDLIPMMAVGCADFTVLYFALFLIVLWLYPRFVDDFYNLPNLLGIRVAGIPIEELLFAASGGAVWSVAYEYVQGYRFETGRAVQP